MANCTKCGGVIQEKGDYHRTSRGPHHFVCPTEEADFGVEEYAPEDAIFGACGILDVVKSEWGEAWSEHDQKVRAGLSRILSRHMLDGNIPDRPNVVAALTQAQRVNRQLVEALRMAREELVFGGDWETARAKIDVALATAQVQDAPAEGSR